MQFFYICSRGNQCSHPCYEDCCYTSNFFKSKLYHSGIKPAGLISFIKDKYGNWWEVDFDWDRNLPYAYRSDPEELISYTYDQISDYEVFQAARRAKGAISNGKKIIF